MSRRFFFAKLCAKNCGPFQVCAPRALPHRIQFPCMKAVGIRSEEHTSELQSLRHLVCRLLLEKKKHAKAVQTALYGETRQDLMKTVPDQHEQHHASPTARCTPRVMP